MCYSVFPHQELIEDFILSLYTKQLMLKKTRLLNIKGSIPLHQLVLSLRYTTSHDKVGFKTYTVEDIGCSRSCRRSYATGSVSLSLSLYEQLIWWDYRYQSQDHAKDEQQLISLTKMKGSSHSSGELDDEVEFLDLHFHFARDSSLIRSWKNVN